MDKRILGVLLVAVVITAGVALAGETEDSGHTAFVPVWSEDIALPNGHVMQRMTVSGICMADDAASPLNGTSINCGGVFIAAADGTSVAAGGSCHFISSAGDVALGWWNQTTEGAGVWGLMGGTGAFAGIKGKGSYTNNPPLPDGSFINDWAISWKVE
jgi:hypothetical protein